MEETSPSEQRPALLPVDTLRPLCCEDTCEFNEYRLNQQPETLKAFKDLFSTEDRKYDGKRCEGTLILYDWM
jgi:hypothetical protein